jgi:hypothetical protein
MVEQIDKLPKWAVRYQQSTIMVPYPRNPRKGICEVCGRSIDKKEIKTTQLHHWVYKYETETVKKNPLLALENTIEVCFGCHKICDWLRSATTETKPENFDRIIRTAKNMPEWMQRRFTKICQLWLEWVKRQ